MIAVIIFAVTFGGALLAGFTAAAFAQRRAENIPLHDPATFSITTDGSIDGTFTTGSVSTLSSDGSPWQITESFTFLPR